ncbi:putative endothelin-converting enzyme [Ixodes scapularis]
MSDTETTEEDSSDTGESEKRSGWNAEPPSRNLLFTSKVESLLGFEVVGLAGIIVFLVFSPPEKREASEYLLCSNLTCYNLRRHLHSVMNLSENPCDDFYNFVCGQWSDAQRKFDDQFDYLEYRTHSVAKMMLEAQESTFPAPDKPLNVKQKAALSYLACTEVYLRRLDGTSKLQDVFDKHDLHFFKGSRMPSSSDLLQILVALALNWNLPVLFQIVLAPDQRKANKRILSFGFSEALIEWMKHRKRFLTPEALVRCIREFVNVLSTNNVRNATLASALVKMDTEVTAAWSAAAASSGRAGRFLRFEDIANGQMTNVVWLEAINGNLATKTNFSSSDEIYASDPRIFRLVDEFLVKYSTNEVRHYIGFHVIRQLAPFTSYRFVISLFGYPEEDDGPILKYVADKCAAAATQLTSFALAMLVFEGALQEERMTEARHLYMELKNETRGSLSWLEPGDRAEAEERLDNLRFMIGWPDRFNKTEAIDKFYSYLPDFKGYYFEFYLTSVQALRDKQKTQLLADPKAPVIASEEDSVLSVLKATAQYSNWHGTVFLPPALLFEPFLFDAGDAFNLGGLGHILAHELWHAALGDVTTGIASDTDTVVSAVRLRKHACLAQRFVDAGGEAKDMHDASVENLADLMGLQAVYSVHKRTNLSSEDVGTGFTPEQLFYIGTCFKWCSATGYGSSNRSLSFTPASLRCNVPLMMAAAQGFGEAFGCRNESKMMQFASATCDAADSGLPDAENVTVSVSSYESRVSDVTHGG